MQFRPGEPYRAALSRRAIFFLCGGLPETGDARFLHRYRHYGADNTRAERWGEKKQATHCTRRDLKRIRSHVSNHLGQHFSVLIPGFFPFFSSLARLSVDRYHGVTLLSCLPSHGIRARVSSLNYLIRRRAQEREIRAPKLMESRKGTMAERIVIQRSHLRQTNSFLAIFALTVLLLWDRKHLFIHGLELAVNLALSVQIYRAFPTRK